MPSNFCISNIKRELAEFQPTVSFLLNPDYTKTRVNPISPELNSEYSPVMDWPTVKGVFLF